MPNHHSGIRKYLSTKIPTFHPNKSSVVLVVLGNLEVTDLEEEAKDLVTDLEEEAKDLVTDLGVEQELSQSHIQAPFLHKVQQYCRTSYLLPRPRHSSLLKLKNPNERSISVL
jgi:hypothetical protein